jgi:hypothetical protein
MSMDEEARAEKIENIRTVVLERVRSRLLTCLAGALVESCTVDQIATIMETDFTTMAIGMNIPGKVKEEGEFEYPATWWDAFKQRWFPWAKINLEQRVCRTYYICPHIPYAHHDRKAHVEWLHYAGEEALLAHDLISQATKPEVEKTRKESDDVES